MGELDEKLNAILNDQQAMGQIMALAKSLGGSGQAQEPPSMPQEPPHADASLFSMLGEIDPNMIQLGMRLIQEYQSGDDKKTALLQALRPFVREERYGKVDRAIQVARLSRVIRVLFQAMGKEGEKDV